VEEWITLLASDPVDKGNEFLFSAYNKIKSNRSIRYDDFILYSTLPAGSEPPLAGMSPWLVWADLPGLSMFENKNFCCILNDFNIVKNLLNL
jgi:hypothetical protein